MRFLVPLITLCSILGLSACASLQPETPPSFEPDPERARQLVQVAETALQQDRHEEAARAYAQASVHARDAGIAQRATQLCYEQGLSGLAEESARRWLAVDPDATAARRYLTSLALARGDEDTAVGQMERLLAGSSTDFSMEFRELAHWLAGEPDTEAALEAFQRLVSDYADSDAARMALADLALEVGRPAIAAEQARAVVRRSPDDSDAVALLARALHADGRDGAALEALASALERQPDAVGLLRLTGEIQLESQDPAATESTYRRILALEPDAADARFLAAAMALEQGEMERAEDDLRRLLQGHEYAADAAFLLGRIFMDRGDHARAAAAFRAARNGRFAFEAALAEVRALAADGRIVDARQRLSGIQPEREDRLDAVRLTRARLEVEAGEPEAALAHYDAILEREPEHPDARYGRGLAYAVMGDLDAAEADLRQLLEAEPGDPDLLNALGYTLADLSERHDEARDLIERALAQRPDEPAFLDSMGWIEFKQGRPAAALEYLQRAWRGQRDPEIAAHLGEVLWSMGEQARAEAIWNIAIELFPDDPVLEATMDRLRP